MEDRFYHNRPYELSKENDLFGTYYKAEAILNILDNTNNYLEKNNILALYGAWGSGKTSVVDYIMENVKKYKCIKFEAWRYENDVNLALSLFELIADEIEKEDSKLKEAIEVVKLSAKALFSFTKHLILNTDVSVLGVKLALGKSGVETIKEMNNDIEEISYYSEVKKFNDEFKTLLEAYTKNRNKKVLIFVDDLDRCDPSKILDLLSAIKHFFSDSRDVVYFCAIDKNAVSQSIDVRYKNVITSEEYLEKIFDINFSMPEECAVENIVKDFYNRISEEETKDIEFNLVSDFLKYINFTNPRKVKKIFNKYIFLRDLFNSFEKNNISKESFVDMNRRDDFYVIMVVYIIILFEFYRDIFNELTQYKSKIIKMIISGVDLKYIPMNPQRVSITDFLSDDVYLKDNIYFRDFTINTLTDSEIQKDFFNFMLIFYPKDLTKFYLPEFDRNLLRENKTIFLADCVSVIKKNIISLQESNINILSKFLGFVLEYKFIQENMLKENIDISKIINIIKMYL